MSLNLSSKDELNLKNCFFFLFALYHLKKEIEQELSLKQAVSDISGKFWLQLRWKYLEQPVIQNFCTSTPGKCRNRWICGIWKMQNTFRNIILIWTSGWPDFMWKVYVAPHVSVSYHCVTNQLVDQLFKTKSIFIAHLYISKLDNWTGIGCSSLGYE